MRYSKEIMEKIFELRESGMPYIKIAEYLSENGTAMCHETVRKICQEVYKEKGKRNEKYRTLKDRLFTKEELVSLKEEGYSYREISEELEREGIKVSESTLLKECKKVYKEKRVPSGKIRVSSEQVYELREKGLSYDDISKYFAEQGITISSMTIFRRCKEIYKERGKNEQRAVYKSRYRKSISNEEIYDLREKNMSYNEISDFFESQGRMIATSTIRERCKKIYRAKGQKEPRVDYDKTKTYKRYDEEENGIDIDDEIYALRMQGLSYNDISERLEKLGIKITGTSICSRCKRVFYEKGEVVPRANTISAKDAKNVISEGVEEKTAIDDNEETKKHDLRRVDRDKFIKIILKLKETRGATTKQLESVAKEFDVNLSFDDKSIDEK